MRWPVASTLLVLLLTSLFGSPVAGAAEEIEVRRLEDGTLMLELARKPGQQSGRPAPPPDASVEHLISHHSQASGLDPRLVRAVIQVESDFDPRARSRKGAIGLMQLMPETAQDLGIENVWDPDQNIRGGTTYLRRMLDRFGGDLELALAGYNAGPSTVEQYGRVPPYPETQRYVRKVLSLYRGGGLTRAVRRSTIAAMRPVHVRRDASGGLVLYTTE